MIIKLIAAAILIYLLYNLSLLIIFLVTMARDNRDDNGYLQ